MERRSKSTVAAREPAVDPAGAYLLIRQHGITRIADALSLLCSSESVTLEEFDAVADGLGQYLHQLELAGDLPRATSD